MGKARFLYSSMITTETMIAVSSLALGVVTTALKAGAGSATITPSGDYTGTVDLEYVIEIDALGTGSVGSSTFKWSDDGGATWDATGVTTLTTDITLNNGVKVKWTTGYGDDFVIGDKWYLKGINLHNAGKMLDFDRDSRYRSLDATGAKTITITFASQKPTALILYDHNLPVGSTITLTGADGAKTVTWAADKILHYIAGADSASTTWVLTITAAGAPAYIEIGELFLGTYLELTRNYTEGFREEITFLQDSNRTSYGIERSRFYAQQSVFGFDFSAMLKADVTNMKAVITSIASASTGIFKPLWINTDSAVMADNWLVRISSLPVNHWTGDWYNMPLQLTEVVKSI
jgi:hypothetical protein